MQLLTINLKKKVLASGTNGDNSGVLDTDVTVWFGPQESREVSSFPHTFITPNRPTNQNLTFQQGSYFLFYHFKIMIFCLQLSGCRQMMCWSNIFSEQWSEGLLYFQRVYSLHIPSKLTSWDMGRWAKTSICIVDTSHLVKSNLWLCSICDFPHS